MQQVFLGNTGIAVSKLCFGTLTMGPLQRAFSLAQALPVVEEAVTQGIDFFDTAELYDTYPLVNAVVQLQPALKVCTKSYAYDTASAEASYRKAVEGIGREYIDVFLLHEQESRHTLRGHWEALEYYIRLQQRGLIGAVGLSTHHVAAVTAALHLPEVQVLHPILNLSGFGIQDGTRQDMEQALAKAAALGKGIFAMKPLAGGHLGRSAEDALTYVWSQQYVHAVAVGMQSIAEVRWNAAFCNGYNDVDAQAAIDVQPRQLLIHDYCTGCGRCVERCRFGALRITENRAYVDHSKCVLCGYCATVCPDVCIKVV